MITRLHSSYQLSNHTVTLNRVQQTIIAKPCFGSTRERDDILPEFRAGALVASSEEGNIEMLRDVIQYVKKGQFNINGWADAGGWGPVHRAAGYGHLEWLKVAHEEGGLDLWVKSNDGTLPIDQAREEGFTEMVKYLEAEYAKGTANPSEKKNWKRTVAYSLRQCFFALEKVISWVVAPFKWLYQWISSMGKSST